MSILDNNGKKLKEANPKKSIKNSASEENDNAFRIEIAEDYTHSGDHDKSLAEPEESINQEKKNESGFKEEFAEDLMNDVSRFGVQTYANSGVSFEKISETQARINYSGLLAENGAQDVFGVYGFGSNQKWENVSTLTLNKEGQGSFMATVPIEKDKNLNVAFKDSAENWDNNSGKNYTFVN